MIEIFKEEFDNTGMKIIFDKTQYMYTGKKRNDICVKDKKNKQKL